MRLVSFVSGDDPHQVPRTGVVEGDEVVDLTDPVVGLPGDMVDFLAAGPGAIEQAGAAPSSKAARYARSTVTLLAPVPRPPKVMGLGMNYGAHVAEMGRPRPENQVWFNKQRTCVIAPSEPIEIPRASPQVDYEGELAFVIGRRCRHVAAADAPSVVAGFSIMNDVSVRDWQWRSPTWTMGKSFDTHGPLGPWLVTPDEIDDPHRLRLRTWVNDELRQDSSTDDMIFTCWQMVEELSTVFTLEPGDVVSTGTPAGVGASFDPPKWLVAGDSVRIELEGVGVLENPVIDEAPSPHP
ncbi:MAG TPA: fumarylacetoacetate hydrolase family protein [Acidimicrobiales bacterium]|nr:fumarylacetoacetate hydrolase family protein [Acidimicrobiales bacterium]